MICNLNAVTIDKEDTTILVNYALGLKLECYDPGSDFSGRLLTGYDYGTPQVSSRISHGQSHQSAK